MSNKHDLPPLLTVAERISILSDLNGKLSGFTGWSWDDVVQATERVVRARFTEHIQRLEAEDEALMDALSLFFDAAEPVHIHADPTGFKWSKAPLDQALQHAIDAGLYPLESSDDHEAPTVNVCQNCNVPIPCDVDLCASCERDG